MGATGCGKTRLADAFGQNTSMAGFSVKHYTEAGLLRKWRAYEKFGTERNRFELDQMLGKQDLLILDDWVIGILAEPDCFSLYEIIEQRRGHGTLIITSVIPVRLWTNFVNDPVLSDSILDRIVYNSYRIEMKCESLRQMPEYGGLPQPTSREETT